MTGKKQYDVGILGWWYGKNYGSIFTYFGLNRTIETLGYRVLMVHEPIGYNGYRVKWPDDIVSMEFARRVGYNYTSQEHFSELPKLNEVADTFVVGSDQLWNPLIGRVNDDLFLDFVGPENKRVAYATSFGNQGFQKFSPEFTETHSENLQKFSAISVREKYAVETAEQVFGVKATQVLDPVFLLPKKTYDDLADQVSAKVEGDYLAVFFLDPTAEKKAIVLNIAKKLGLSKIAIIPNPDNGRDRAKRFFKEDIFEFVSEDTPETFLATYRSAKYVVTDSFHGSAFSVIFEKPFSSIYNTKRGADRFKNLLASLGFGGTRRVLETDTADAIMENPNISLEIDFTAARRYLETETETSLRWLKDALADRSGKTAALFSPGTAEQGRVHKGEGALVTRPEFTASNDSWHLVQGKKFSEISVAADGAIKGNRAWCDLPFTLRRQGAYRLSIRWKVRTAHGAVNLHVRNPETGKFRVIGTVPVKGRIKTLRTDTVDFVMPEPGFSQFMLGALHFTGPKAGADIESITVQEIPAAAVKPGKTKPSHAELVKDLSMKDSARFINANARPAANANGSARARLMFHAHALEKGLSRSDLRPGFGKIAIPGLAKEMNGWLAAGNGADDQFFQTAASVMHVYFERHKQLKVDVSDFRKLFNAKVLEIIESSDDSQGGVMTATAPRNTGLETNQDRHFLEVVYGRRSIREFTSEPVKDEDIRRAVHIAMQAPSVCNRQAARVHQFENPREIKAALDLQGGFSGYKMPPRLLLVTCDLTAFLFAAERNQPFIDGGLFMMNLLLGLEQVGLGSCSLNTAMNDQRENALRKLLNIPENEVFIAFVATGHFDPMVLTPQSKRIAVDEVLVRHGKAS